MYFGRREGNSVALFIIIFCFYGQHACVLVPPPWKEGKKERRKEKMPQDTWKTKNGPRRSLLGYGVSKPVMKEGKDKAFSLCETNNTGQTWYS